MDQRAALHAYQRELATVIEATSNPRKTRSQRAMVRAARQFRSATLATPDEEVLVWSDLHLGHENIIEYANRPFGNADEMNAALWDAWNATATPTDHLLVVGDVAMGPALCEETWERIAALPGTHRTLVVGNHDLTGQGELRVGGFDTVCTVLLDSGEPPIIFTHYPLHDVPEGHVNIHGHQHARPAGRSPHINVAVEQLGYRPVRLDRLRALARRINSADFPEGTTTAERLEWMEMEAEESST